MYKDKRILALIPARSGSKGIPGKNLKPFSGKPLVVWTIEQAKKNSSIDSIIVSTEDEATAEISKQHGADVPFLRPKELASDEAKGIDVVLHAIEWLEKKGEVYDLIVLLQPTSPLRMPQDIDNAIEMLFSKNAKAVVSVSKAQHHPERIGVLDEGGCMANFLKRETVNKNRQELSTCYTINGAIYVSFCDHIKKEKSFFGDEAYAYVMPLERSIDIDEPIDFKLAEYLKENEQS